MVSLLRSVLCDNALSAASHERLRGWLDACETGHERLRAGLPPGWTVGDKTGTGERGAVNDVAIATPPRRGAILVASYLSDSTLPLPTLAAAHADIARAVACAFS